MSPTKDRLEEMKRMHNSRIHSMAENDTAADSSAASISEAFQRANEIREFIQIVNSNTKRANEILKSNLFKLSPDLQDELDSLFRTTTTTSYKVNNILTQLDSDLRNVQDTQSTEYRIKSVQVASLKAEFQRALQDSSNSLEYHKNKRRELLKKSLKTACKNINDEELEALLDENKLDVFTDNHLLSIVEAKQQLSDIEDRHKELLKIEKQLSEVLDLFVKVGTLVEQQQENINRVEYHAGEALEYVERAKDDVQKSKRKQNRCRKKKIYLALIIAAVVVVCVLIMLIK